MLFPDDGAAPHGTRVCRVLIVADPGAGKTTLAVPLARFICPKKDRMVVVGPVPKLAVSLSVPYHDLSTSDRGAQETFFRKQLVDAKEKYPEGERLIAIDEADLYFSGGGKSYGCPALQELGNTGRNYFVSQILICRAPLDINRNARGLVSCMFIGHLAEPRTQEWFEDYTGIEGFGQVLRDIEKRKFILYAPGEVPHVLGVAWVEGGEIVVNPWTPPEESEEENPDDEEDSPAPPSGDETTALTPGESASTPAVTESSPTGTSPGTAPPTG